MSYTNRKEEDEILLLPLWEQQHFLQANPQGNTIHNGLVAGTMYGSFSFPCTGEHPNSS